MCGSLPVQQWTILGAREQMIWVGWVEVDFPHCTEKNKENRSANKAEDIAKVKYE